MNIRDLARRLKDKDTNMDITLDELEMVLKVFDRWTKGILSIILAFIPRGKR